MIDLLGSIVDTDWFIVWCLESYFRIFNLSAMSINVLSSLSAVTCTGLRFLRSYPRNQYNDEIVSKFIFALFRIFKTFDKSYQRNSKQTSNFTLFIFPICFPIHIILHECIWLGSCICIYGMIRKMKVISLIFIRMHWRLNYI